MTIRRDPNGQPMTIGFNGSEHFYLYNAQGDVVAIANYSGEVVVEYTYDAWGNPLSCTGSLADTLGKKNPFRYRGYVYDEETGLYYLKSRYYDPRVGRFICADALVAANGSLIGKNMFTYCANSPVRKSDSSGKSWDDAMAAHKAGEYIARMNEQERMNYIGICNIYAKYFAQTQQAPSRIARIERTQALAVTYRDGGLHFILTQPAWGSIHEVNTISKDYIPAGYIRAADFHTHPLNLDIGNTKFSSDDKKSADKYSIMNYVVGANQTLLRYDSLTTSTHVVGTFSSLTPVSPQMYKHLVDWATPIWDLHFSIIFDTGDSMCGENLYRFRRDSGGALACEDYVYMH